VMRILVKERTEKPEARSQKSEEALEW